MAGQEEARYSVEVWDIDEFFAILGTFRVSQQERATEIHYPPEGHDPGMLKELKGRWAGVYQLECGGGRRLLYEVDDARRSVMIIYLGNHPEWEKRGKTRR